MFSHGTTHEKHSSGSTLDAVLLAEHEATERLERAKAAAAELVAAATANAEEFARHAAATLNTELADLDAAHAVALREMEQSVAQAAAYRVALYRTLDASVVSRLASVVLADVTGLSPPPAKVGS